MESINLLHYALNIAETSLLYSLIGCGFYLASVCNRHFAFACAVGFVVAPYVAIQAPAGTLRVIGSLTGITVCALLGLLYQLLSSQAARRGARDGELLIISLATLAIIESAFTLASGSGSRSLMPLDYQGQFSLFGTTLSIERLSVIGIGATTLAALAWAWKHSLIGMLMRGLIESPLNLVLRGFPVTKIQAYGTAMGFAILGLAGTLCAVDGRIKPAMCTDVAVIGAVIFIVGDIIGAGPLVIIGASVGLAFLRFMLSLFFEGDWAMTPLIFLLGLALMLRRSASDRV